jgi:hypothetical protein
MAAGFDMSAGEYDTRTLNSEAALRLDPERYAFEMNDTVKIRSFRSGLTLAGQLQQRAVPRIGPWVLVGDDCAAILRQSLRQISDLGRL